MIPSFGAPQRVREYTERTVEGPARKHLLESPAELLAVLADQFGLVFAPDTRFTCPGLVWP